MPRIQLCFACYLIVVAVSLLVSYGRVAISAGDSVDHHANLISELAKPWNLLGNTFGVSVGNLNMPPFIRNVINESE